MKKVLTVAAACFVLGMAAKAQQCNKTIKWTTGKSEFIDGSGNVQRSKDEAVEVVVNSKKIDITMQGPQGGEGMKGDVSDYACNWNDDKNGKTVFKSTLTDTQGTVRHATVTIESVNGLATILLAAEEEPQSIKLTVAFSEEVQ